MCQEQQRNKIFVEKDVAPEDDDGDDDDDNYDVIEHEV